MQAQLSPPPTTAAFISPTQRDTWDVRLKLTAMDLLAPSARSVYAGLDWEREAAELRDPHLDYPTYYTVPHHGMADGYLSGWQAVGWDFVERVFRMERVLPQLLAQIATVAPRPQHIVELGCGTAQLGITLAARTAGAHLTLLDLSPYQLAAARRQATRAGVLDRTTLVHAPAEATRLPSGAADLIVAPLLFHELPQAIAATTVCEAYRMLAPSGHLVIFDAIQRALPWPWADQLVNRGLGTLLHEVYWLDYQTQPVWPLCQQAGFAHVERRLIVALPWVFQVVIARV